MIITVTNQKGGVGKTTTAVSIAGQLASAGQDVLLVDFDQQGHCAIALGMDPEPGVFGWLVAELGFYNCRRRTRCLGLELVPGNSKTKVVELVYRAEANPHGRVQEQMSEHKDEYHHMIVDTPAAGLLQEAAVGMADAIVVPVRLEHLGLDGVNATLQLVEQLNPSARVIVVPNQYDARLREHRYNLALLMELDASARVSLAPPISARVAVAEAVACGQTIWEYNGRGLDEVRGAYSALVELLKGAKHGA